MDVPSGRATTRRSGTLRRPSVSVDDAASEAADELSRDRPIAVQRWIEDGHLEADGSAAVDGDLEHGFQVAPAQPARQSVVHRRHDGIIENVAVKVHPEALEVGAEKAFDRVPGLFQRGGAIQNARVGDDPHELAEAEDREAPRNGPFGQVADP